MSISWTHPLPTQEDFILGKKWSDKLNDSIFNIKILNVLYMFIPDWTCFRVRVYDMYDAQKYLQKSLHNSVLIIRAYWIYSPGWGVFQNYFANLKKIYYTNIKRKPNYPCKSILGRDVISVQCTEVIR